MLKTYRPNAVLERASAESNPASLAEIISALSFALDLTEGAVPGHALRSCLLGMRLGMEVGLSDIALADLYHALLMKDVGCSSNAARMCQIIGGGDDRAVKSGVKLEDWTNGHGPHLSMLRLMWRNVSPQGNAISRAARILHIGIAQRSNNKDMIQLRCDRGASIVRKIGMSEQTAEAVRGLDEHWDGNGYPERLRGKAISPLGRIMAVAQHLDVFGQERGASHAMLVLRERRGTWFDPELVKAAESLHRRGALWHQCLAEGAQSSVEMEQCARAAVIDLAPSETSRISASQIDHICEAFAEVVDAKSPFTFKHSIGVTDAACGIGAAMGFSQERTQLLQRAALLHDLGKLRVPNSILDKPGRLNAAEWAIMKEHPGLTRAILGRVKQFQELAEVAGAHHEKLDGTGYPDRLRSEDLSLEARIVAVADMYGALTEDRSYRKGYSAQEALKIIEGEVPAKLDGDCFEALSAMVAAVDEAAPTEEAARAVTPERPVNVSGTAPAAARLQAQTSRS